MPNRALISSHAAILHQTSISYHVEEGWIVEMLFGDGVRRMAVRKHEPGSLVKSVTSAV